MTNRKKILFLCPFNLGQNTGTPIRLKTEIEALSQKDSYQLIVCCQKAVSVDRVIFIETDDSLKVFNQFIPRSILFWLKAVWSYLKYRPNIVHSVSPITAPVLLFIKLFSLGQTPLILEVHGLAKYEYRGPKILYWVLVFFDWLSIKLVDSLVAMAFSQKKALIEMYHLESHKIEVIWGPVAIEKFNLTDYKPTEVVKKICYTGNDSFWQGVADIVAVAKEMEADPVIFELFGVSSWPDPVSSNLRFRGRVDYDKLFSEASTCDIFLSTRMDDEVARLQYPQKLSFYLSAGRPVVVSSVGDQQEIVERERLGEVYCSGDHKDLLIKIRKICSLPFLERLEIGQRARVFAEKNLSLAVFVNKVETVYNRLS